MDLVFVLKGSGFAAIAHQKLQDTLMDPIKKGDVWKSLHATGRHFDSGPS
ncbi:hypothetical protein HPP92_002510 [Vanilla planifolia]|uniref:Uncharacterized protein n=1 Tax=Vanilla planifolia TaxID=51239 RepID=A0A835RYB6_VANPL|nr:hypothetical protein HPP92_002510 [Vanilla planifolia]